MESVIDFPHTMYWSRSTMKMLGFHPLISLVILFQKNLTGHWNGLRYIDTFPSYGTLLIVKVLKTPERYWSQSSIYLLLYIDQGLPCRVSYPFSYQPADMTIDLRTDSSLIINWICFLITQQQFPCGRKSSNVFRRSLDSFIYLLHIIYWSGSVVFYSLSMLTALRLFIHLV